MSVKPPSSEHDQRLERVLADYLHAVEAGTAPDRAELLRRHADLAAELDSFFRNRDALERVAEPLKHQVPDAETLGLSAAADGGMTLRYFGDYELLAEIARGGMGMVFKARQVSLNRIVAVKMILAGQLASSADVARFRAEAAAAGKLDHPNIVPIYEIGEHEGQHYFSMKFIEGGSLAQCPRMASRGLVDCVVKVARAVHHAHQRGILHRDLKPGNILIDAAGEPHVTDFGLAKRTTGEMGVTQTGAIVGTPSYMAPEQARSEKVLTTGVDIYSLGAILYELLTGVPPFRAETPLETVLQVLEHEPAAPRSIDRRIDRDLETICLKCLAKDVDRRYESAAALADDLERWLRGEPITARRVPWLRRAAKWARRKPALAGLLLVGVVSAAALIALGVLLYRQQGQALLEITGQKNRVQAQLLKTLIEQARTERRVGNRAKSLELLGEAVSMQPGSDLRTEAIESITSFGVRTVARLRPPQPMTFDLGQQYGMALSTDGQWVAYASPYARAADAHGKDTWRAEVHLWHVPTGDLVTRIPSEFNDNERLERGPSPIAFSPTDPLLAVVRANRVHLLDLTSKEDLWSLPADKILGFSPNGTLLAVDGADGAALWNIRDRKQLPFNAAARTAAFASNEKIVLWDGKRLRLWNVANGSEEYALPADLTPLPASAIGTPALYGDHLIARQSSGDQTSLHLALWSIAKRAIAKEFVTAGAGFGSGIFRFQQGLVQLGLGPGPALRTFPVGSADGLIAIAESGESGGIRLIDVNTAAQVGRLASEGLLDKALPSGTFNPQGRLLAVHEDDVKTWRTPGNVNVASANTGGVRLWDLHTGKTLTFFKSHHAACWSPDGRYLAMWDRAAWERSGPELVLVEVTASVVAVSCGYTPAVLTFGAAGRSLASAKEAWQVRGQPTLRWLGSTGLYPDPGSDDKNSQAAGSVWSAFGEHASGHRLWLGVNHAFQYLDGKKSTRSLRIAQLFPSRQEWTLLQLGDRPDIHSSAFAISPDGKQMIWAYAAPKAGAVAWGGEAHRVEVWDLATRQRRFVLNHGKRYEQIRYSADGRRAFLGGWGSASIWELEPVGGVFPHRDFTEKSKINGGDRSYFPLASELNPDLTRMYTHAGETDDDHHLLRFDTVAQKVEVAQPVPHDAIAVMALSPDGVLLATGGKDRLVRLWDATTLQELATLPTHPAAVTALAWSPSGDMLASASRDGTIHLWDLPYIRAELAKLKLDW